MGDLVQNRTVPILQDNNDIQAVNNYGMAKDDLVILDRRGYVWKQVRTGEGGDAINLENAEDVATLESWLLQVPH